MTNTADGRSPFGPDPVDAARGAIWRLFQEGYMDEDMATAGLLAVDLGTRRTQRDAARRGRDRRDGRDGVDGSMGPTGRG